MSGIEVNPDPAMCRYLVEQTTCFAKDPVVIADVGARDGFNAEWAVFGDRMRVLCFEPDHQECARLAEKAPAYVSYVPAALGREQGKATLYEAALSYSTGLYPSNAAFFARLLNRDNATVVGTAEIEVDTLDSVIAVYGGSSVNFLKLDAEGAELDILLGGEAAIRKPQLFGILSEIRFHPEINGSPPFWELDRHLQERGYRLFGITANAQSRRAMPYPGTMDYFRGDGTRFYAYTTHGQVMDGDALYFRDLLLEQNRPFLEILSPAEILKCAALYEIYHHNDAAVELILACRDRLAPLIDCDALIDRLVPRLHGRKLSYRDYMAAYFDPATRFAAPLESSPSVPSVAASEAADEFLQKRVGAVRPRASDTATSSQEAMLRQELESVYASTSWRVTRPLRALKSWLG